MLKDIYFYLMVRKKFFLLPIILVVLTLALFLFISQATSVGPFVYTLF
jgi:hypothetical protein